KRDRLNAHRMDGVVLDPRASVTPKAPPFPPIFPRWNFRKNFKINSLSLQKNQRRWVKERLFFYEGAARFWRHFLKRENIKVYVTWMKYDAQHCPLAEALRETGGVLAVFQRALDVTPFIETQVDTDIYFGYSKWTGEVERQVGSKIPYFIVTGYLGDHRFELLKPQAQEVREKLLGAGANHILSFTDEGSSDDARWYTDHAHVREDYAFLLEKILKNKHLGLVLKPKIPSSLRHRLGPLVPLLEEALKTGRCYLYEDGDVMGSYPPAVAALSADIAIHGYLSAPTASLETALAGVPTLLMDREGWHSSPLYALGKNKVIFNDWDSLWEAVSSRKQNREGNSPLGDWSPLIGEMDPFRDGRGAQRMGTYLHWMMEGFKEGWNRERVLAYAAEKYVKAWGQNKVISI
ncbi:MAG: hypothetical protein Q8P84_01195, partial [Deltaproteobacteria bacterium]|nr:hypothetical protein [Deltaproteobacteria bacterium]